MSAERYLGRKLKFGLPAAAVLTIFSIACGSSAESRVGITDCGASGTNSSTKLLHNGEKMDLLGVPVAAKAGKIRVSMEDIGPENTRLVARYKFRVTRNGYETDVSMKGTDTVLLETPDRKKTIEAQGKPAAQSDMIITEITVNVTCKPTSP